MPLPSPLSEPVAANILPPNPPHAGFRRAMSARLTAKLAWLLLLPAVFAVRLAFVFHYRFDSDEPQHLHVVWGWTRGLRQYKDVFDNHMPLFHLVCAPVFQLVGERPDALIWMRMAMVPLFFLPVVRLPAGPGAAFGGVGKMGGTLRGDHAGLRFHEHGIPRG